MSCRVSECLCGACGDGANYPAAPGAVAAELRMTNELSAGGWESEGEGWGLGGAKVTASAACLLCVATHSDSQHIVTGGTFGVNNDSRPPPGGNQEKMHPVCCYLSIKFCHVLTFFVVLQQKENVTILGTLVVFVLVIKEKQQLQPESVHILVRVWPDQSEVLGGGA